jgi:hypothetical protein
MYVYTYISKNIKKNQREYSTTSKNKKEETDRKNKKESKAFKVMR